MHIELVFIVLMLGHILGDFYFQSDKLAKERKLKYAAVVKHSLFYALTMTCVLLLCIPKCSDRLCLIIAISLCHFIIDSLKYGAEKLPDGKWAKIKKNLFVADQVLHFAALAICWYYFGKEIDVKWFVSQEMVHLPNLPITIFLGMLLVGKPIGIWIANSNLRNYWPENTQKEITFGSNKNAGKTIGYLERVIVLVFLMYKQFGAIAFVLTAKSVARFKDIEKDQRLAEYYLIGTLMSVVSAILIAFFLGLVPNS